MECKICLDVEKVRNPLVKCPFVTCQFEACRKCCQRYMLDQRASKCMDISCGKEWGRKFVVDTFQKTFITGEWKKMKEQVLFEREKALLPATQGVVQRRIILDNHKKKIREVDALIQDLYLRKGTLEREYRAGARAGGTNTSDERRTFVRACAAEDCRGFLSTQWKCGTCGEATCLDCHEAKKKGIVHICNPDNVATAILLNRDTKPCPKCAIGIFKIDGCDQMWCTQCQTAFSWRSGHIETKIHNPHYYEWQRRMNNGVAPRVEGDGPCINNGLISQRTAVMLTSSIKSKLEATHPTSSESQRLIMLTRRIYRICESILHLTNVQLGQFQGNGVENNLELRVDYLLKNITEEEFKIKVQRANKSHEKKREILEVLNMFVTTVGDIMHRAFVFVHGLVRIDACLRINGGMLVSTQMAEDKIGGILDEIDMIRTYSNECLLTIATIFGSKPKQLVMYDIKVYPIQKERNVLF